MCWPFSSSFAITEASLPSKWPLQSTTICFLKDIAGCCVLACWKGTVLAWNQNGLSQNGYG
eukprot:CAMPEP_0185905152 /NCGR_PEP_ID=MMETSP0196C-20130402/4398_1 /TAXON_ID=2932 /ORGANISM="Alexandrium fundyense, Strain CCMP1719" /LENGTH=60 /DNA_ID=CAMNT_0028624615 /DNA_START=103 /DNA_END=281 /DNA_ORIENTATION=-